MLLVNQGLAARNRFLAAQIEARKAKDAGDLELEYLKLQDVYLAKKEMQYSLDAALSATARFYGFRPEDEEKSVINGPLAGLKPGWSAAYYDDGTYYRQVKGPNGFHYLKIKQTLLNDEDQRQLGTTMDDGLIVIRLKAFEDAQELDSPRVLASILYHETVHYNALVTTGWSPMGQVEAYAEEVRQADILGLTKTERQAIVRLRDDAQTNLDAALKDPAKRHPSFVRPEDEVVNRRNFGEVEKELAKMKEYREDLGARVAKARREREIHRHLRSLMDLGDVACTIGEISQADLLDLIPDQASSIYCSAPEGIIDSADQTCSSRIYGELVGGLCKRRLLSPLRINELLRTRYRRPPAEVDVLPPPFAPNELGALAAKACGEPGSLTQAEVDKVNWFPDPRIGDGSRVRQGLGDCAQELFDALLGFNRKWSPGTRLNADWVNGEAGLISGRQADSNPGNPDPSDSDNGRMNNPRDRCYDEPGVGRVCPVK